jgi:hypothetical protein
MKKEKIVFIENRLEELLHQAVQAQMLNLPCDEFKQYSTGLNQLTESYERIYNLRHKIYGDSI